MDLDTSNFSLDYATIQRTQKQDSSTKVTNPKSWLIVKFGTIHLLTCKGRIYLPSPLAKRIVEWYHINLTHPGKTHTYMTVGQIFFAFGLKALVQACVTSCTACQKGKHSMKKNGKIPPPSDFHPKSWGVMQVNLFGPWKVKIKNRRAATIHTICMIAACTRWVELHPIINKTSENISLIVNREWFCRYPTPEKSSMIMAPS
eukprot:11616787-Ditylum_brightwellii.AAC.1